MSHRGVWGAEPTEAADLVLTLSAVTVIRRVFRSSVQLGGLTQWTESTSRLARPLLNRRPSTLS